MFICSFGLLLSGGLTVLACTAGIVLCKKDWRVPDFNLTKRSVSLPCLTDLCSLTLLLISLSFLVAMRSSLEKLLPPQAGWLVSEYSCILQTDWEAWTKATAPALWSSCRLMLLSYDYTTGKCLTELTEL